VLNARRHVVPGLRYNGIVRIDVRFHQDVPDDLYCRGDAGKDAFGDNVTMIVAQPLITELR
jgi:hypothetical protein